MKSRNSTAALTALFITVISMQEAVADCVSAKLVTPDVGYSDNTLASVSGTSADDVWAVGSYTHKSVNRTLIEHFNGAQWVVVPSPNDPKHPSDVLQSVSAISPNDAWAVGAMLSCWDCNDPKPFALRWNGSEWSEMTIPQVGQYTETLVGVAINPSNSEDVWMVGDEASGGIRGEYPTEYAQHWNGATFRSYDLSLTGVSDVAVSRDGEAWASGTTYLFYGRRATQAIDRWTGTSWEAMPFAGKYDRETAVSALPFRYVWAVGQYIEQFDGAGWQYIYDPVPQLSLGAVSALSMDDAWATGPYSHVLHWDGTRWYIIPQPYHREFAILTSVQALSNGAITVGYTYDNYLKKFRTYSTIDTCTGDAPTR